MDKQSNNNGDGYLLYTDGCPHCVLKFSQWSHQIAWSLFGVRKLRCGDFKWLPVVTLSFNKGLDPWTGNHPKLDCSYLPLLDLYCQLSEERLVTHRFMTSKLRTGLIFNVKCIKMDYQTESCGLSLYFKSQASQCSASQRQPFRSYASCPWRGSRSGYLRAVLLQPECTATSRAC